MPTPDMHMNDISFVIIGAAKSATTWLQRALQADPAIFMPDPELHYFSRERHRGDDWYLAQFAGRKHHQLAGEKSNSYLNTPGCAAVIHKALPGAKLIAQLRNPVDRAYSDYCMLYRRGEVDGDIARHLDPRNAAEGRFLSSGLYSSQLADFLRLYERDALLVLTYEGIRSNPEKQLSDLRSFIGLPGSAPAQSLQITKVKDKTIPMISPAMKRYLGWLKPVVAPLRATSVFQALHRGLAREIAYPEFNSDLRRRLQDHYSAEVERMENLMHRRLHEWRTK
jgi:Sulfotransferase domain